MAESITTTEHGWGNSVTYTHTEQCPLMPAAIQIGSVTYMVTRDPQRWMALENRLHTSGYYGHTDHTEACIYLNPTLAEDVVKLTLWHEVLHAVCEAMLGDPAWRHLGSSPEAREEAVVRMLESPTLLVLRDNPALVEYLTNPS